MVVDQGVVGRKELDGKSKLAAGCRVRVVVAHRQM